MLPRSMNTHGMIKLPLSSLPENKLSIEQLKMIKKYRSEGFSQPTVSFIKNKNMMKSVIKSKSSMMFMCQNNRNKDSDQNVTDSLNNNLMADISNEYNELRNDSSNIGMTDNKNKAAYSNDISVSSEPRREDIRLYNASGKNIQIFEDFDSSGQAASVSNSRSKNRCKTKSP